MRAALFALLILLSPPLAGCLEGDAVAKPPAGGALVRFTDFGVPHVVADDWRGLGLGVGYVQARQNLCLLAEEYVTVSGQRAASFGSGSYALSSNGQSYDNAVSDAFWLALRSPDLPEELRPRTSLDRDPDTRLQMEGFVAGYNRYVDEVRAGGHTGAHEACRDADWLRPITPDDAWGRMLKLQLLASSYFFAPYAVDAGPAPGVDAASVPSGILPTQEHLLMGSNGYALGGDVTENGAGMLLGNPHFPWYGPERFSQLHVTIPGELDVMGMTLNGAADVLIGFNDDVAWTHTVSTAWRFTIYELALDPSDPYVYTVDGERHDIVPVTVEVPVRAPDGVRMEEHTLHFSHLGPIIELPLDAVLPGNAATASTGLTWDGTTAYTVRDANLHNDRILEQFRAFGKASSVEDVVAALESFQGIPWVNTIAADRHGSALYADVGVVPDISDAQWDDCNVPVGVALTAAARLPVLDGSRGDCAWAERSGQVQPGILPPTEMPRATGTTWLINSNDSHWLPNPDVRLEGYPRIIGDEGTERSLRTRMGYEQIATQVAAGPYDLDALQGQLLAGRMLAAELAVDAVLEQACPVPTGITSDGVVVDLGEACAVLGAWDRTATVDAVGTGLFERFWRKATPSWSTPFDEDDPANTPSGFTAAEPSVRLALADAVAEMQTAGVPLDAPNREVRGTVRDGLLPVAGAASGTGTPSMMNFAWGPDGFGEPYHGNSYVQTVTWDEAGVVAEAVLAYSQSNDPGSTHHADQTRAFADGRFAPLPFAPDDVAAATVEVLRLAP